MSVPNLKPIAQFVQKLLRGPKISKFGGPDAVGVRRLCLCQI